MSDINKAVELLKTDNLEELSKFVPSVVPVNAKVRFFILIS